MIRSAGSFPAIFCSKDSAASSPIALRSTCTVGVFAQASLYLGQVCRIRQIGLQYFDRHASFFTQTRGQIAEALIVTSHQYESMTPQG